MIAFIQGVMEQLLGNAVIVNNNGIGYLLNVTQATMAKLPPRGQEVRLYTSMSVKEDSISLYGFLSLEEVNIYHLLISVSGVGPKAALGLLSILSPAQIIIAILSDDGAALGKAPGVGKKTAQRICLELKDKMRGQEPLMDTALSPQQSLKISAGERQDAMDALAALGYSRSEAVKAVMEVALEGMKADQIIKLALKKLVM